MANITASMVKELRELSGCGMMDCKNVLVEADGDMEKAAELLREKGLAKAVKKSGRIAAEGMVQAYVTDDAKEAVLAEINCETDFVAKTPAFGEFVMEFAKHVQGADAELDLDGVLALPYGGGTFKDEITSKVASIGENITARRFARLKVKTEGIVEAYIHLGGKIGVIIELACEKAETAGAPEFKTLARDIAMHIAATNPMYLAVADIDQEVLDKEAKIYRAQALEEGKPENIVEKMVTGRIKKYEKEICLLEQPFVKDPDMTITQLLAAKGKELGDKVDVGGFVRYEMGEGLQKREDDFEATDGSCQEISIL